MNNTSSPNRLRQVAMVLTAILALAGSVAAWGYFYHSQQSLGELDATTKELVRLEGELKRARNDSEASRKELAPIRLKAENLGNIELSSAQAALAHLLACGLGKAHPDVRRLENAISELQK